MSDKFLFNHFFKLDGIPEGAKEVSPVGIEKSLKTINSQSTSPILAAEFSSEELKSITEALLENVKNLINSNKFNAYFSNTLTVSAIQEDAVEFVATTSFIKKIIESLYTDTLRQSLSEILGKNYEIKIDVLGNTSVPAGLSSNDENILHSLKPGKQGTAKKNTFFIEDLEPTKDDLIKAVESRVIEHQNNTGSGQIDSNKSFNNFIIGPSNNMAYAFSMAVAKEPGKTYPALYIYGNSGLGKTHLIHAIANYIQNRNPGTRICMTSANRFMNEMVEYIKSNKVFEFRRKYTESTDVLIIDDVHELKNKSGTQEQFFHIFNELVERGKQLIFTSDKIPKEIDGLEDRIRTRLSQALPVEIQQPDLETRIAILKKKAIEKDIYLSDDVVNLIAKCVKSNIRELEGCLIKLGAVTSILKVDIDLEIAKEHLKLNEELENQKNLTIESIAKTVANYFKLPIGDVRGKAKTKEVVLARQVAMYIIHRILRPTLKENGHYFSNRDHSTVLHAVQTISDRMRTDSHLAQCLLNIEKQL